jgi:type II secretory ATPase GspE/PulE/Tfp pilus assembly ATPase PilB-like protein
MLGAKERRNVPRSATRERPIRPDGSGTHSTESLRALAGLRARNPHELHDCVARLRRRDQIRLHDALLAQGSITAEQLEQAGKIKAKDPTVPLGVILRSMRSANEEAVQAGLAFQLGVPAVDLRHWPLELNVLGQIPAEVARSYRAVPIHAEGNLLYVAMSDVLNREILDALRLSTSLSVQSVYAPVADVQWMLDTYCTGDGTAHVSDEDLERNTTEYSGDLDPAPPSQLAPSDNVIVRLADQIIADAYRERASDIHIEPMPEQGKTVVRVRIDGQMFTRRSIPWAYRDALVSRYKVMANMNVAEHRIPQDGKILFRKAGTAPLELRVAVLPTAGGIEDVVLRILNSSAALPLKALGLSALDHARLRELIEKPYGILLVCGPTGSGKTTTLHALMNHLNDGSCKIWTVENPVEITQSGLRQVQVNVRAGLTFATALRAFLRADPDVIMVGEIRDTETAKTALEASLTGHLVLSTLHTNNAPESVVRLLEMGMNPFNFSDALLGMLAQRLVRCLCKACCKPVEASDEVLMSLAREYVLDKSAADDVYHSLIGQWRTQYGAGGCVMLYQPRGCAECANTGYRGRLGVFELMPASTQIKQLIINGASATQLLTVALDQGMETLKQDGIHKVLAGTTDLAQVLAVCER